MNPNLTREPSEKIDLFYEEVHSSEEMQSAPIPESQSGPNSPPPTEGYTFYISDEPMMSSG